MSVIFGNYTPPKKEDEATELAIGIFLMVPITIKTTPMPKSIMIKGLGVKN
ncbi:hypothetical protein [Flavobacterium sp. 140616W15]|uniref:hypothetical protein n=1 Tax=Flavobacterium sp. 140616W15 TaxID=2478552 RepID=UPI0013EAC2D6|nr:hypothetical protein [Flavobacterium sp. 140616W15]